MVKPLPGQIGLNCNRAAGRAADGGGHGPAQVSPLAATVGTAQALWQTAWCKCFQPYESVEGWQHAVRLLLFALNLLGSAVDCLVTCGQATWTTAMQLVRPIDVKLWAHAVVQMRYWTGAY